MQGRGCPALVAKMSAHTVANHPAHDPMLPSRIAAMSQYMISRQAAEDWALKGMKFLTYDDHDVKVNGYDSDDEEGMMNFALQMSTAAAESKSCDEAAISEPGSSTDAARSNGQCQICAACPDFPQTFRVKKLRIVRPYDIHSKISAVNVCNDYVAVSYCWPLPTFDDLGNIVETPGTYQITELDGSVRLNRAFDEVLDRAIDAAKYFGLRMIWIDQECLPQPREDSPEDVQNEQQLGIQAMDIVYNRALVTVGLHDGLIMEQTQMDVIATLREADMKQEIPVADTNFLHHACDFLEMVSRDRWYTRAWVAQEALSAGNGLVMAFRKDPSVKARWSFTLDTGSRIHDANQQIPQPQPSSIYILPKDFQGIVRAAKMLLERNFMHLNGALVRYDNQPFTLLNRAGPILRAAEALHPRPSKLDKPVNFFWMKGGRSFAFRATIDAAGALTLLKSRQCRDQRDRLAIVANMCNYDRRLDTRLVTDADTLYAGIVALALLNGDLSLLVPEVYTTSGTVNPELSLYRGGSPWPPHGSSDLVDHVTIRNYNTLRLQSTISFSDEGFMSTAYLWHVDDVIDLSPCKYQWDKDWQSLKCLQIEISRLEKETDAEHEEHKRQVAEHFSKPTIMKRTNDALSYEGQPLRPDSAIWGLVKSEGVRITHHIVAARLQHVPQMQQVLCEVVFGILRYLMNYAETEPRAAGLANSIWQSLRADMVNGRADLPDHVGPSLFEHPAVVAEPFKTLQLDVTRDGSFSQLWFVDRIMQNGALWVGRYIPKELQARSKAKLFPPRDDLTDSPESASDAKGKELASTAEDGPPIRRVDNSSKSILERQMTQQMLATMFRTIVPQDDGHPHLGSAQLAAFGIVAATNTWTEEAEDRREKNLVSTFDVEGPCIVATPYSSEWESLSRPELRSMSVCWVVEHVKDHVESSEPMPAVMEQATHDGNVSDKTSRDEGIDTIENSVLRSDAITPNNTQIQVNLSAERETTFRVVRKVQGMWEIMELPWQRMTFI